MWALCFCVFYKCALCSVAEEAAKKGDVTLIDHPAGADGDASDSVPVELRRPRRTVQPPDGTARTKYIYIDIVSA